MTPEILAILKTLTEAMSDNDDVFVTWLDGAMDAHARALELIAYAESHNAHA